MIRPLNVAWVDGRVREGGGGGGGGGGSAGAGGEGAGDGREVLKSVERKRYLHHTTLHFYFFLFPLTVSSLLTRLLFLRYSCLKRKKRLVSGRRKE